MDIDKYIKELPAEMQEKAHTCKTGNDLVALFKDAGVPLPDGMIADLAGGITDENGHHVNLDWACPECGSHNLKIVEHATCDASLVCLDCGYEWFM